MSVDKVGSVVAKGVVAAVVVLGVVGDVGIIVAKSITGVSSGVSSVGIYGSGLLGVVTNDVANNGNVDRVDAIISSSVSLGGICVGEIGITVEFSIIVG